MRKAVSIISPNPYVSPYGLGLIFLRWREVTFSNHQILLGLPFAPFSHPDSLECWYLRHEPVLSISAWEDQTWGISGRYPVAEDACVWGLHKSRDASQPVNL